LGQEFPVLAGVGSHCSLPKQANKFVPEEAGSLPVVLEIGCGVGNSLFPLMELNTDKFFIGFDCSPSAIDVLRSRPGYNSDRCHVFVLDAVSDDYESQIPPNSIDIAILIFVLSAISPQHMSKVLTKIHRLLTPSGLLLFRDYGRFDMTQLRFFAKKSPNKMGENYYRRGDGTFAYFFERNATQEMFESVGFRVRDLGYDTRVLHNRKRKLKMYRVWIKGTFEK